VAKLLRMPEVAAGGTEAVLSAWLVEESAGFTARQTLMTIETEKAVVDVEADAPGVLVMTLVPAGAAVEVGAPVAVLADPGEVVDDLPATLAALGVGGAEAGAATAVTALSAAPDAPPSPVDPVADTAAPAALAPAVNGHAGGRIFASPLARRLALEGGVDLATVTGTGPGGRLVRRDIEAALRLGQQAPATEQPLAVTVAPPATSTAVAGGPSADPLAAYTDVPHSRSRRAIARRLTQSVNEVPHFYLHASCRADALLAARAELNEGADIRISVTDLLVKAAARALVIVPEVNAIWTEDAVRQFSRVDIGLAVASRRGLVSPVLRGVETLSIREVATGVRDLVARADDGRLRQDELEGGAFSISNLGMFGVEDFSAIINPPQAAILAVGAARLQPVVDDGALAVGQVMRVTLSVDHRAVDGALAAQWLQAFASLVEAPIRIFA